ncbi:MAG: type II/IV secretion system protein [Phycisphaerales bacterium]|nr:type II/IV secretion system protein [Phycisphaerales bacterium]MBT7170992.1 type II/IV secretion system protein [Phycisphaerales bacterium]
MEVFNQAESVMGDSFLWSPQEESTIPHGPEDLLHQRGQVTREQLDLANAVLVEQPWAIVIDVLVEQGAISDEVALETKAEYFQMPFRRIPEEQTLDSELTDVLQPQYMRSKMVLPLESNEDGSVVVAIANPEDIFLIDDLRRRLGREVILVVSPPADILAHLAELVGGSDALEKVEEILGELGVEEDSVEVVEEEQGQAEDLEKMAGESPVIRYVNYIITSAVREGASDIHIEPSRKKLRVRFRMDGILFEQSAPPVSMTPAILSRLKIMSKLDIAETRIPQDGRIRVVVQSRNIDLRVSILPTAHGEKCVIRILDGRSITVGLEKLGFRDEMLEEFMHQINQPNGIVLVTGPTGSGKSTTLYSALQVMDRERLNISTVEDPVEYELDGINQVHVRDAIGMTFSAALRSLLRQDPDIIMVGEIRDGETARIAVQASLTGHMVLSTLHTNDAPSTITRLINIGVEPYLISAALSAVLAQRLVRRICPECKEENNELTRRERVFFEHSGHAGKPLYRGAGCEKCRGSGYKGRVGLYELLVVDDELADMISTDPGVNEIREAACRVGMKTLQEDGVLKAIDGQTTIEEVLRVSQA